LKEGEEEEARDFELALEQSVQEKGKKEEGWMRAKQENLSNKLTGKQG
jgi:hypothetical protein